MAGSLKTVAHAVLSLDGLYLYLYGYGCTHWVTKCSAEEHNVDSEIYPSRFLLSTGLVSIEFCMASIASLPGLARQMDGHGKVFASYSVEYFDVKYSLNTLQRKQIPVNGKNDAKYKSPPLFRYVHKESCETPFRNCRLEDLMKI